MMSMRDGKRAVVLHRQNPFDSLLVECSKDGPAIPPLSPAQIISRVLTYVGFVDCNGL